MTILINCRDSLSDNYALNNISISPNPSNATFTINMQSVNIENYSLQIKDVLGRAVAHYENINAQNSFVFGKELSDGLYFTRISKGDNFNIIKIIKNK